MRRRRPFCRPQLVTEQARALLRERELFLFFSLFFLFIRVPRHALPPSPAATATGIRRSYARGRSGGRKKKRKRNIPSTPRCPYIISYRGDPVRRVGIGATPTCVSLGRQPKLRLLSSPVPQRAWCCCCYCSRYFCPRLESLCRFFLAGLFAADKSSEEWALGGLGRVISRVIFGQE